MQNDVTNKHLQASTVTDGDWLLIHSDTFISDRDRMLMTHSSFMVDRDLQYISKQINYPHQPNLKG